MRNQARNLAAALQESVTSAEILKIRGEELIQIQEKELEGSLRPKCDELQRMKDALQGALQRRLDVLRLSKQMHEQISVVSDPDTASASTEILLACSCIVCSTKHNVVVAHCDFVIRF